MTAGPPFGEMAAESCAHMIDETATLTAAPAESHGNATHTAVSRPATTPPCPRNALHRRISVRAIVDGSRHWVCDDCGESWRETIDPGARLNELRSYFRDLAGRLQAAVESPRMIHESVYATIEKSEFAEIRRELQSLLTGRMAPSFDWLSDLVQLEPATPKPKRKGQKPTTETMGDGAVETAVKARSVLPVPTCPNNPIHPGVKVSGYRHKSQLCLCSTCGCRFQAPFHPSDAAREYCSVLAAEFGRGIGRPLQFEGGEYWGITIPEAWRIIENLRALAAAAG